MSGQLLGSVMLRPVRIGMAFTPSVPLVHRAVETATTLWGGLYQPFLNPGSRESLQVARALALDVITAMDRDHPSSQLASSRALRGGAPANGLHSHQRATSALGWPALSICTPMLLMRCTRGRV